MIGRWFSACALALALAPAAAFDPAPQSFGWHEIPGTALKDVCPPDNFGGEDYLFSFYCQYVTRSWNSGTFDPGGNRLYIWGGGHNNYYGNEIYALDLAAGEMLRLTDPAVPRAVFDASPSESELAPHDGTQPNSRHTYDGMAYLEHADRIWAFSGSLAGKLGSKDDVTWIFDPADGTWQRVEPGGDPPAGAVGLVSAYDPVSQKVFLHNRKGLYSYEYGAGGGTYTKLAEDGDIGIVSTAVIDPVRRLFFILGAGNEHVYDIGPGSDFQRQDLASTGDRDLISRAAPGVAFDPVDEHVVGWVGDGKVYRLDPDTREWSSVAFAGAPDAESNGTYDRFAYVPDHDAFVIYSKYHQNAYTFRPPRDVTDTSPPAAPVIQSAEAPLPTVARIAWSEPADDFGVAGYRVYRDGELMTETANLEHSELGLIPDTSYVYTVVALDSAGHESAPSAGATVHTPARQVSLPLGDCSAEANLAGREDVVFCEPWEDADWWTAGYLRDPTVDDPRAATADKVDRTEVVSEGCFSGNCLKAHMFQGATNSLSLYWPLAEAEMAPEEIYLRYYLRLAPDFDPRMCNDDGEVVGAGGKFPGPADVRTWADPGGQCGNGGQRGDGINCWSMRSTYRSCGSNDGEACATKPDAVTRFGSYVYHPDQHASTGDSAWWDGDDYGQITGNGGTCETVANNMYCGMGDGGVLVPDRWYRIEMQVRMNTPGQPDGVIRGWVDGVLSYEKTNTVFRFPNHDLLHNRLVWLNIFKGGVHGNCTDSAIYLDQMVITTDGPPGGLASDTAQPPDLFFDASPGEVALGDSVTLEWQAGDATSCTASGGWSGDRPLSGSEIVAPTDDPTAYRLDCEGPGGAVSRIVSVSVEGGVVAGDADGGSLQDTGPPTAPGTPQPLVVTEDQIDFAWTPALDDVGVAGYRVFKDGLVVATVEGTEYSDAGLGAGETHRYAVEAFDGAGNVSARSGELVETTHGEAGESTGNMITLYPDSDTFLTPSTVSAVGNLDRMEVSSDRKSYLRFPLGVLPEGATVASARLVLYDYAQYGAIDRAGVFRAGKDWHESVATRTYYDSSAGLPWDNALGDWIDADGVAQGDVPFAELDLVDDDTGKWVEWDVTSLVRAWVDGDFPNQGMVIRTIDDSSVHLFRTRETSAGEARPRLEIELSSGPEVTAFTAAGDTFLTPSTVGAVGGMSRLEVSDERRALVRFDLNELAPGTVVESATLRLYSYAQYGQMDRAGVFHADKPWSEAVATRSYYDVGEDQPWDHHMGDWLDASDVPQGDQPFDEATLVDDNTGKWIEWEVTDLVQAWLDGSLPNHGVLVRAIDGGGTHLFRSRDYDDTNVHPQLVVESY